MQEEEEQFHPTVAIVLLMLFLLLLLYLLSWTLNCSTSCKSAKENCLQVTQQVVLVKISLGIWSTSLSTFCQSINEPIIFLILLSSHYHDFITSVNSPLAFRSDNHQWSPLTFLIKPLIPISDNSWCISCLLSFGKLSVIVINSLPKGRHAIEASNAIINCWMIGWNQITNQTDLLSLVIANNNHFP